jgi:hypothetical protein
MRKLVVLAVSVAVGGCAFQRAEVAQDARSQMVGMSKERVLGCMGPPVSKAAEGSTEVWGYDSGNGMQVASISGDRYSATAVSSKRFCKINIVFAAGQVSSVNYSGPTGGILTAGEQCAYAVDACVVKRQ